MEEERSDALEVAAQAYQARETQASYEVVLNYLRLVTFLLQFAILVKIENVQ